MARLPLTAAMSEKLRSVSLLPMALAVILSLAACLPTKDRVAKPTAPAGTAEYVQQQLEICEARGGRIGSGPGSGGLKVCYTTPADANQPCNIGTDCEGLCLSRSRTCAPVVPLYGCNDVITDTGLPATICVD